VGNTGELSNRTVNNKRFIHICKYVNVASTLDKNLGHVLGRDRPFQTMALAFGGKPALPYPFVVPHASGGVPNCGAEFLLRFGNKVVLCDKKMVLVHE
jgi:hypothetical protein